MKPYFSKNESFMFYEKHDVLWYGRKYLLKYMNKYLDTHTNLHQSINWMQCLLSEVIFRYVSLSNMISWEMYRYWKEKFCYRAESSKKWWHIIGKYKQDSQSSQWSHLVIFLTCRFFSFIRHYFSQRNGAYNLCVK